MDSEIWLLQNLLSNRFGYGNGLTQKNKPSSWLLSRQRRSYHKIDRYSVTAGACLVHAEISSSLSFAYPPATGHCVALARQSQGLVAISAMDIK